MELQDYVKDKKEENMELQDYVKDKKEEMEEKPKFSKKRKKVEAKIEEVHIEMTDDECVSFYRDLTNMIYMIVNPKMRSIELEEIDPIKTSVGNVIRKSLSFAGDFKIYMDMAVLGGFSLVLYKNRKNEILVDEPPLSKEKEKK